MALNDYDALLVLSFGGPEGEDEVIPFLENVTIAPVRWSGMAPNAVRLL